MYQIKYTAQFEHWLGQIKDRQTRLRLSMRLDKVQRGLLGDVKPVGAGVYEMREHFGLSDAQLQALIGYLSHMAARKAAP